LKILWNIKKKKKIETFFLCFFFESVFCDFFSRSLLNKKKYSFFQVDGVREAFCSKFRLCYSNDDESDEKRIAHKNEEKKKTKKSTESKQKPQASTNREEKSTFG
jgi:hypothetical protein